ncbi:MAG: helix-turn-helix domain-containing protein [Lachnospiraceae bacterium]|nr:helix-turn-helix domain-containing protein [Lachnospiraceae bacterium]
MDKEVGTKERILQEALKLFAQNGYMATSMSDIAKKLDITKAALYKHYVSKQEIFDCIVKRMNQMDQERVKQYQMPEGTFLKIAEEYKITPLDKIKIFTEVQFRHWTEEDFSRDFRKMLTLEQYRSQEMADLYQNYLAKGPIDYMTDLFAEMIKDKEDSFRKSRQIALDFYGPIFLLMSMYDNADDKEEIFSSLNEHIERFARTEHLV